MVGVPRSRGCQGCKQQKKKCSGGTEPPCVRCKRLDIPCVGLGERKIKFQDEGTRFAVATRQGTPSQASKVAHVAQESQASSSSTPISSTPSAAGGWRSPLLEGLLGILGGATAFSVPANLSNGLTTLTSSYARTISDPSAETNFGLIWSFGPFLADVPQHLGRNEALDAAVEGLVLAYDNFRRTSMFAAGPVVLGKYSKALQSLRTCLMTTERACESETLAAIMVLMIFEILIGVRDTRSLRHCEGAARIFRCRGSRPPGNELERKLLLTLRGPVVTQALFTDDNFFTDAQWKDIVAGFSLPDDFEEDTFFPSFAGTTRLFQRSRKTLREIPQSPETIDDLKGKAASIRKDISDRLFRQSQRVSKIRELQLKQPNSADVKYAHSLYTRDYAMLLATQVLLNSISTALASDADERAVFESHNSRLRDEMCLFAELEGQNHRPLGSLYVGFMLHFAYVGATRDEEKRRVITLMDEYAQDYAGADGCLPFGELEEMGNYMSLKDITRGEPVEGASFWEKYSL